MGRAPMVSNVPRVHLNQGTEMPMLGLGVARIPPGEETRQAVARALDPGYRLIDTAALYGNEEDIGAALRANEVPRDEVFVTTKLGFSEHGFERSQEAARASLKRLGLSYIDLYLIHTPQASSPGERLSTWRGFEQLQREGICRAIGVSNFSTRHLEELREGSTVLPAINQVEFHPFFFDPELLTYCSAQGTVLEAWSPLIRGRRFEHPMIRAVAAATGRTPAQVLLRWGIQHGAIEIPKSVSRERMAENMNIFDFSLSPDQMARLDALRGGGSVNQFRPAETL